MANYDQTNVEHVDIVERAAVSAWRNCAGIGAAIRESLEDEDIRFSESAALYGLEYVRAYVAHS